METRNEILVQYALRGSRYTALLKVKHAKQTIALDAVTSRNLSNQVMHHLALAQQQLNFAQAELEREGV